MPPSFPAVPEAIACESGERYFAIGKPGWPSAHPRPSGIASAAE